MTAVVPAPVSIAVSTVIFALRSDDDDTGAYLRVPLVRRIREPFKGKWALPGGPIGSRESLAEAASRGLVETTRLTPTYLEQLYAFGDADRAPGDRVVSIVYWAVVRPDEAEQAAEGENVRWFAESELPELAFDHDRIIAYALRRLRTKLEYSRVAHAFLGPTFTLAELRQVYEAVLQKQLDPANFRRQIGSSRTVVATGEVREGGRNRPPRLYRFDDTLTQGNPNTSP